MIPTPIQDQTQIYLFMMIELNPGLNIILRPPDFIASNSSKNYCIVENVWSRKQSTTITGAYTSADYHSTSQLRENDI